VDHRSGPGIAPNTKLMQMSLNLDLMPTFLELAAGKDFIPEFVDGHSMLPFILPKAKAMQAAEAKKR